jgi:hypothetical protein
LFDWSEALWAWFVGGRGARLKQDKGLQCTKPDDWFSTNKLSGERLSAATVVLTGDFGLSF